MQQDQVIHIRQSEKINDILINQNIDLIIHDIVLTQNSNLLTLYVDIYQEDDITSTFGGESGNVKLSYVEYYANKTHR